MAAEQAARKIAPESVDQQAVVEQVAPSSQPSLKEKIFGGLGNFVKTVAPTALSLIPGVGPIAGKIAGALSSLNDDDWFDAFSGAGASFNELLKYDETISVNTDDGTAQIYNSNAAVAEVITGVNGSDDVKHEVLTSLLAYVRKKTNNVLMEDPDTYWTAFIAIARLHALYYCLRKYVECGKRIPVNIPALGSLMPAIQPKVYNQLVGIADALEAYLKTTTGLPYAYASYMRWRFGTIFHSDNTGKPGLVFYNVGLDANYGWTAMSTIGTPDDLIDAIANSIEVLKRNIATCGRAAADFHTAFDSNGIDYTVEVPHYDAKEFNLRVNAKVLNGSESKFTGNHRIVMDSRLQMNAALQAVTISTANSTGEPDLVPFPIYAIRSFCYNPKRSIFPFDSNTIYKDIWDNHACKYAKDWYYADSTESLNETDVDFTINEAGTYDQSVTGTKTAVLYKVFAGYMGRTMFTALQFHNIFRYSGFKVDATGHYHVFWYNDQPLAYDTAHVSIQSLTSIHRTALRNLTRGEYSKKQEVKALKEEYKDAAQDMAKEILPTEIKVR